MYLTILAILLHIIKVNRSYINNFGKVFVSIENTDNENDRDWFLVFDSGHVVDKVFDIKNIITNGVYVE